MMFGRACTAMLGLLALGLAAQPAIAQTPVTGSLAGRVTLAASGDPVHGATVIVVAARRQGTSGEDGRYLIDNIAPGTYEVVVQREQLSTARQPVTIVAGQTATLDFELTVGVHEAVTVTASATGAGTTFESFNAVTTVDSTQIAKRPSTTIADILQNEAGMSKRSFGPGASRPVIRGFDGDRVLVMQDGVRTGDLSSQSGDHGVSIDPAGLARIEVVRGPATLLYGSNAIGGVVNAISPQETFRSSPFTGILGGVTVDTGSANEQAGVAGNLQIGHGPWHFWSGGGARRTSDYDTPLGTIDNSATRLSNGRAGIGWNGTRAFFSAGGQFEDSRFGIPFAGMFHAHHEDEPVGDDGEHALNVDIKSARREFRADAGLRNLASRFVDAVRLTFGYTDYGHDEIEIDNGIESVGTQFTNDTSNLRVEVEQKQQGRLGGRLGFEFLGRDFGAIGEEALAPDVRHRSFAGFLYEELTFGRWRTQFGARIERNAYQPGARMAHVHDGDEEGDHLEAPAVRDRTFTGASGSFGIHADLGAAGAFVANLTAATRAPALEELYNFGAHVGNLAFEIGNPNLSLERTTGLDLSLRSRAERLRGEVNFFVYDIRDFVFLDLTGEIEDGLRVAEFLQSDARFIGMDATAHTHLGERVTADFSVGTVRARLTASNESLPRIPPLQGRVELGVTLGNVVITPELLLTAKQSRVFRDETTTAGWATGNLAITWSRTQSHGTHLIALQWHNIANATYRLHTSFLKDLAPEMGRGVKLSYTLRFF